MKILYVASKSDFIYQTLHALRQNGAEVLHLDDRVDYLLPPYVRGNSVLWKMRSRIMPWRITSSRLLQRRILEASVGYDVLLAGKGTSIRDETLRELRARSVKTAVWFPDNALNEPYASWVKKTGPLWDNLFSFDSAIASQAPNTRTHTLPFAVEPSAWDPGTITDEDRMVYECDICFIGAPYPERVELLSRVRDLDLRIWGWSGWSKTRLAANYRGPLNAAESAKAYRLAKIVVNTNILPHAHGVNLKTFEICAAGGFQLTDKLVDLERVFEVDSELVAFENADEFERLVRAWIDRDDDRQRVADAGRARVLRDHTMQQRMHELLHIIGA